MSREDLAAQERSLSAAHKSLVASGVLARLELGGAEERLWMDCDLASFAENRLGEQSDPFSLDRATRERWNATALDARPRSPREMKHQRCYWIVRDNECVGTFALSRFCLGEFAYGYSVFLRPPFRGRGIMSDTLRCVHAELERHGLGLRLETGWTWRRAMELYLKTGFWLRVWKRDLEFVRGPRAPAPIIAVDGSEASVSVQRGEETVVLARARRGPTHLVCHEEDRDLPDDLRHLSWDARTTLALAMALQGWPLIRSEWHWEHCRYSDAIHPEALALRIQIWEEESTALGWRVETPRTTDEVASDG